MNQHLEFATGMFAVPVTAESMSQHGSLGGIFGLPRFFDIYCSSSNGAIRPISSLMSLQCCFAPRAHC